MLLYIVVISTLGGTLRWHTSMFLKFNTSTQAIIKHVTYGMHVYTQGMFTHTSILVVGQMLKVLRMKRRLYHAQYEVCL